MYVRCACALLSRHGGARHPRKARANRQQTGARRQVNGVAIDAHQRTGKTWRATTPFCDAAVLLLTYALTRSISVTLALQSFLNAAWRGTSAKAAAALSSGAHVAAECVASRFARALPRTFKKQNIYRCIGACGGGSALHAYASRAGYLRRPAFCDTSCCIRQACGTTGTRYRRASKITAAGGRARTYHAASCRAASRSGGSAASSDTVTFSRKRLLVALFAHAADDCAHAGEGQMWRRHFTLGVRLIAAFMPWPERRRLHRELNASSCVEQAATARCLPT